MPTYHSPHSYLKSISGGQDSPEALLTWNDVDLTDGTWTLFDPDNLVQSISFSNGFNTIVWNVCNPNSDSAVGREYHWGTIYAKRAPRWHRSLTLNSTNITGEDYILFNTYMRNDESVNDFNQGVVVGCSAEPSGITAATLALSGGYFTKLTNGATAYGSFGKNGSSTSSSQGPEAGLATSFRGGGSAGSGAYHTIQNNQFPLLTQQAGGRNTNDYNVNVANSVSVVVGVGLRSNTDSIDNGHEQRFAARYSFAKLNTGP